MELLRRRAVEPGRDWPSRIRRVAHRTSLSGKHARLAGSSAKIRLRVLHSRLASPQIESFVANAQSIGCMIAKD